MAKKRDYAATLEEPACELEKLADADATDFKREEYRRMAESCTA